MSSDSYPSIAARGHFLPYDELESVEVDETVDRGRFELSVICESGDVSSQNFRLWHSQDFSWTGLAWDNGLPSLVMTVFEDENSHFRPSCCIFALEVAQGRVWLSSAVAALSLVVPWVVHAIVLVAVPASPVFEGLCWFKVLVSFTRESNIFRRLGAISIFFPKKNAVCASVNISVQCCHQLIYRECSPAIKMFGLWPRKLALRRVSVSRLRTY